MDTLTHCFTLSHSHTVLHCHTHTRFYIVTLTHGFTLSHSHTDIMVIFSIYQLGVELICIVQHDDPVVILRKGFSRSKGVLSTRGLLVEQITHYRKTTV